jgi:hypothetical protein
LVGFFFVIPTGVNFFQASNKNKKYFFSDKLFNYERYERMVLK